ncbi:hypothetical protein LN996_07180 [Arthrobacter sp. AK01]|uniref:zinc finger domain-containing protein n=1 Tax=Arthrobacter sp. AK01 TaxID=2894084 RepID=UPI001E2D6F36|nr:hypothetical protein [Arthrobacter sp. AK01]MCD4850588.1 hypothetical protein [Arthrobacter sp. AK01]
MIAAFARTQGGFRPFTEQLRGSIPGRGTIGFSAVHSGVPPVTKPQEFTAGQAEENIQAAAVSEAVPAYDPAAHGFQPYSLEEVVDFAAVLTASLGEFQNMLLGCTTPLNLRGASKAAQKCLVDLVEVFGHLAESRLIIAADLPIAAKFGAAPTAAWNPSGERGPHVLEPGELLSPKQIHTLRQILQDHPEYPSTTYSALLAQGHNVPPLVVDAAKAQKAATARDERRAAEAAAEELVPAVLEDVESRGCPRCEAEEGQYCRTSTGRIAEKPHAGRIKLSPLASDNPNVVKVLSRQAEAYEEFAGRPWPYS